MWVCFWALCSVPLVCMSFLYQYRTVWLLCNIVWDQGEWCLQRCFFLLKSALAIWGLLRFHTNFRIIFSISGKKCHWNFDRDCIESIDGFQILFMELLSTLRAFLLPLFFSFFSDPFRMLYSISCLWSLPPHKPNSQGI